MIWRNAHLLDTDSPVDLRLADGRITAVTPVGSDTADEVLDLDGRIVIAGLWDAHVHFDTQVALGSGIDVSGTASAAEAAARIASSMWPAEGVVFAHGFRSATWADRPTADMLDALAADRPIVALSGDLHGAWLNSAAHRMFGLPEDHTGHLLEYDAFTVEQAVLSEVSTRPGAVERTALAAARRGVVGVVDFQMQWQLDTWQRRMAGGFDGLRVVSSTRSDELLRLIDTGWHTGQQLTPLLSVGAVKVIGDGSLSSRTAWCHHGYADEQAWHGAPNIDVADLTELMAEAHRHGLHSAIHAIGDRAVSATLDAFEASGALGSIEHAQLIADDDLPRFARLGVTASVQPTHLIDDWSVAEQLWAGELGRMFPLRSLLDAGARLDFGSDAPVAPLDPWHSIATAVHREPGGEPWHVEQAITLTEALRASTRSTIGAGEVADLVALDADPRMASSAELAAMPVAMTALAGRLTAGR